MREAKTALKSGSSPLALSSFPKLFDRLCAAHKGTYFVKKITEKCASIFLGSRTVSLSRSSGETLAVHSTEAI